MSNNYSFTKALTLLLVNLCLFVPASLQAAETDKPNMIFVLVDDQRFDAMGMLNPLIKTPNMDKLAQQGTFFKNSFVITSLCSPSRATILTGLSTRNHQVVGNSHQESDDLVYYPSYLQKAGYETAMFGKWHMGGSDKKRKGFDHWHSFPGQGFYTPEQRKKGPPKFNINGKRVEQTGYITDELTDYVLQWIKGQRDTSKPFFMHFAHKAVHANFSPPKRYTDQYKDVYFPEPASQADTAQNYKDKPRWLKTQRNSWHGVEFPYYATPNLQQTQKDYYAALLAVDDSLGRLVETLEQEGLADNTIIFLMGDNGFMFGEHGLIDKRVAYEPSMRVPFFAYGPEKYIKQGVLEEVVANIDIAPTMLDFAGVDIPEEFEGDSLKNLLQHSDKAKSEWNNEMVYEYYWDYTQPHTPTTFAIRTEKWKYIYYHGVWDTEELYNIVDDPKEMTNLANKEDFLETKFELRDRLFAQLKNSDGDRMVPFEPKKGFGTQYRNVKGTEYGELPAFFYRKAFETNPAELLQPPKPE